LSQAIGDQRAVAASVSLLGDVARFQHKYDLAKRLLEESLATQRQTGDRWGTYHTLYRLGELAKDKGEDNEARLLHEESLTLRREHGDKRAIAGSLENLSRLAFRRADYVAARELLEESLALYREIGATYGIGLALTGLGRVAGACAGRSRTRVDAPGAGTGPVAASRRQARYRPVASKSRAGRAGARGQRARNRTLPRKHARRAFNRMMQPTLPCNE